MISTKEYLLLRQIKIIRKRHSKISSYLVRSGSVKKIVVSCRRCFAFTRVVSEEEWGAIKVSCPYILLQSFRILGNSQGLILTDCLKRYSSQNWLDWKFCTTVNILYSSYTPGYSNLLSYKSTQVLWCSYHSCVKLFTTQPWSTNFRLTKYLQAIN